MLLEYTYENANKVLQLFNEGKIAELSIHAIKADTDDNKKYVINYTLVSYYRDERLRGIEALLSNPKSYKYRLQVTELLNKFIEHMASNSVNFFDIDFSVVEKPMVYLKYTVSFIAPEESEVTSEETKANAMEELEKLVTKMGAGSTKVENAFRKEGAGKNRRNVQYTIGELVELLKTVLTEE